MRRPATSARLFLQPRLPSDKLLHDAVVDKFTRLYSRRFPIMMRAFMANNELTCCNVVLLHRGKIAPETSGISVMQLPRPLFPSVIPQDVSMQLVQFQSGR